jgi:hypothetical protein
MTIDTRRSSRASHITARLAPPGPAAIPPRPETSRVRTAIRASLAGRPAGPGLWASLQAVGGTGVLGYVLPMACALLLVVPRSRSHARSPSRMETTDSRAQERIGITRRRCRGELAAELVPARPFGPTAPRSKNKQSTMFRTIAIDTDDSHTPPKHAHRIDHPASIPLAVKATRSTASSAIAQRRTRLPPMTSSAVPTYASAATTLASASHHTHDATCRPIPPVHSSTTLPPARILVVTATQNRVPTPQSTRRVTLGKRITADHTGSG